MGGPSTTRDLGNLADPGTVVRVLLVEDNSADAELVAELLRNDPRETYAVEHVARLADAQAALNTTGADVVLLDLGLPDSRGAEGVEKLRTWNVPIVVLTGTNDDDIGLQCISRGAQDYLCKNTLDPRSLTRTIGYAKTRRIAEYVQQSQKLEAIGRLAGGVAHDFNNLLTVIVTYAGFVREQLDSDHPGRADLDEVLRASEQAKNLTAQLLAFSRRQPVEPRVLDVNELLRDVHRVLRRTLTEDIEVVLLPLENLACVNADPGQLEQVLMNLAVNARDAMPKGGKITIATANGVQTLPSERLLAGDYVVIRVEDTGVGMSDRVQGQIFEPFFTTKEKGKGTGLGLATCYGLVRQMGGDIRVVSRPGSGSVFEVWLPQTSERPGYTLPKQAPSSADLGGSETVLVVEDDGALRRSTARILREGGYRVLEAGNGDEAVRVVRGQASRIDLVVTDIVMPQMGGRELAGQLTRTLPELRILFMTGYTADTCLSGEIPQAQTDVLYKPFMAATLLARVRRLLDRAAVLH